MIAREIGLCRIVLVGAILGAAVGATIATVVDAKSGPTFWAALAAGALVGSPCLLVLVGVVDLVRTVRRTLHRA